MQKNFTDEDFEDFLKQNADGLKLTPSIKTWKGIEKRLPRPRRWTAFMASAFLLTASLFGYLATDNTRSFFGFKPGTTADNTESNTTEPTGAKVVPITKSTNTSTNTNPTSSVIASLQKQQEANITVPNFNNEPLSNLLLVDADAINAENFLSLAKATTANKNIESQLLDFTDKHSNLLRIENVSKFVKAAGKKKKTDVEFFFTPTISYRKLTENKSYLRSMPNNGISIASSYYDVKNMVTHRPHMGVEFGFAVKYKVAKAIKIRSGLQFNVNGYEIKAFDYVPEIATISLNNRSGVQSVNTISNYRNFNGGRADWLHNTYFQISAPVGVEVKLKGSDKVQVGIATSIQPTYLLSEKAYLISNDYKNYSQVPWLMRRWNVNTSVETFIGYSTGTLKWQVGPQVRYQLLSSFQSTYPVKENLLDVGLKVGVSLNKK